MHLANLAIFSILCNCFVPTPIFKVGWMYKEPMQLTEILHLNRDTTKANYSSPKPTIYSFLRANNTSPFSIGTSYISALRELNLASRYYIDRHSRQPTEATWIVAIEDFGVIDSCLSNFNKHPSVSWPPAIGRGVFLLISAVARSKTHECPWGVSKGLS